MKAGNYIAKPVSGQLAETKNGKEHVAVELSTDSGERITYRGFFSTEKQTEFTVKSLRTMGWTGDDLTAISFPADKTIEIVVVEEEFNGKMYAKVKYVNPLDGPARASMDAKKAQAFAAKMKAKIASAPVNDSDIPF